MIGAPTVESFPELDDFLAGCAMGQLRIPRCFRCERFSWPPRPRCRHCMYTALESVPVSPLGQLYSWTVVHRTRDPGFTARTPYAVVIVALAADHGTRLVGPFTGPPGRLSMGMSLQAVFDTGAGTVLPAWGEVS